MSRSSLVERMIENEKILRARSIYCHHKAREYAATIRGSLKTKRRSIYLSAAAQMNELGNTLLWQALMLERYRVSMTSLDKLHSAAKEARVICAKVLLQMSRPPPMPPLREPDIEEECIDVSDWPTAPTTPPLASAETKVKCEKATTVPTLTASSSA